MSLSTTSPNFIKNWKNKEENCTLQWRAFKGLEYRATCTVCASLPLCADVLSAAKFCARNWTLPVALTRWVLPLSTFQQSHASWLAPTTPCQGCSKNARAQTALCSPLVLTMSNQSGVPHEKKKVKSGLTRPARPTPDCHNAILGEKDNCNTASSSATSECPSQYQKKKSEFIHEFDPPCGIQSRWGDRRDHRTVRFWDWTHLHWLTKTRLTIAISSFITMLPATGVKKLDTITSTRNEPLDGLNASEIDSAGRTEHHNDG